MKKSLIRWLKETLYIQALITCVSIPILSWHGIPFNPMGIIATTLFLPFITLFLFVSTLLFFTQLAHIPNGVIVTCLDYITRLWLMCLPYHPKPYTFCLAQPPHYLLFCWIIAAILSIMVIKAKWGKLFSLCTATSIYVLIIVLWFTPPYRFFYVDGLPFLYCRVKNISMIATIDTIQSHFKKKNWHTYQFTPTLIQKTGVNKLNSIVWLPRKRETNREMENSACFTSNVIKPMCRQVSHLPINQRL